MKLFFLSLIFSVLSACTTVPIQQQPIQPIRQLDSVQSITRDLNQPFIGFPQPDNYSICHGHTCSKFAFISLSEKQWFSAKALFQPVAGNAEQEREQIRQAVALLEELTGEQAGTDKDRAENNIIQGLVLNGQMDCIDESTNTTVYLRMLDNDNLLHFHSQAHRITRGIFSGDFGVPHTTATIVENASNTRFVVDSWFGNNGELPDIVPLELWKSGWKPETQ